MKKFFVFPLLFLVGFVFLGCQIAIKPGHHGMVIVSPPPPPTVVTLSARPHLVFVNDYGIYVATDVHHDIFFDGTVWFYFTKDHWFRGKHYNGPWKSVEKGLPPGLRKVPPGKLKKMALKVKHKGPKNPGKKHRKKNH